MAEAARVSVVVLTYERPQELARCLARLAALPEQPPVIVVDNASRDADAVAAVLQPYRGREPPMRLLRRPQNEGAAGRNAGVAAVQTPYVAFCDDDTGWAPGALARAADVLDTHPALGVLQARLQVGDGGRDDPACAAMANSPLDAGGLPGPALIAFMAGAVVMRAAAFRVAGGYEPRFFLGAEEALLALDLAARGWRIAYVPEVVARHWPSPHRDSRAREIAAWRNRLWLAALRLPAALAARSGARLLREAARTGLLAPVLRQAAAGLPWALRRRQVVPAPVAAQWQRVFMPGAAAMPRGAPRHVAAAATDAPERR